MAKQSTRDLAYIALFAVLIAICSWIAIPILQVPYTLQTFAVFLAVGVLGGKRGTLAVLVYILLGAVGVPVFAGFTGGLGVLLGTTGGYILGFLCTALLMWLLEALLGRKLWVLAVSMVLGPHGRGHRPGNCAGLVCDPLHHSRPGQARPGSGAQPAAGQRPEAGMKLRASIVCAWPFLTVSAKKERP